MDPMGLLRELLKLAAMSPVSDGGDRPFPPEELRFVLEYSAAPDVSAQVVAVTSLLGSSAFKLVPLTSGSLLDRFLVLRFPAIERTLPQRDLFAVGYALVDALGLVSAEPDLATDFYADPESESGLRGVESASVLSGLCWVQGEAPADHRWALESAGILAAWGKSRGAGIVVAQPDTGIALHDEIDASMLAIEQAADILDGDSDPQDPLSPGMANPGHGTGTASVLASRETGLVSGAAPQARVAPIRCIEDVKVFNAAPVAAAIAHAIAARCDVISMSLGGVPSRALHAAVRAAVSADMIVVAAAGNCVRVVVWPARYDEVIAVAGSNLRGEPWKGTCRGATVDICAPAEFVWRAQRATTSDPTSTVSGGQGTSFAAALVSGAAALWLSYHGRDAVIAESRRRNTSVQRLFRGALHSTVRRPAGWDAEEFGPGIVDAGALLALTLADIPEAALEEVGAPTPSVRRLLDEEIGPAPADAAFPWHRYEAEIAVIALSHAKLGASIRNLLPEAKVASTRPSPQLAAASTRSSDPRLARFSERPGLTGVSRPPAIRGSAVEPRRLELAMPSGAGLESAGGTFDPEKARQYLQGSGRAEQLTRLEAILRMQADPDQALRSTIVDSVDEAIGAIARGEPMTSNARMGLEALVSLNGRPALRLRNGVIDLKDPRAREWHDRLFLLFDDRRFQQRTKSVGRIDVDGAHMGTGFVVGHGRVLTNRHVLQTFAAPVPRRNNPERWVLTSDNVTIDFADAPSSNTAATRFRVKAVIGAGPSDIKEDVIDFTDLDAALLEVESSNAAGTALPDAIQLVADKTKVDCRNAVLVVGYPARPASLPRTKTGEIDLAVAKRLNALFGSDYGTKYVSPGEIERTVGSMPGDASKWCVTHDATTLGGSSGSCLIGFDEPVAVIGLHFGGRWMRENYAHAVAELARDSNFLTDPLLKWLH